MPGVLRQPLCTDSKADGKELRGLVATERASLTSMMEMEEPHRAFSQTEVEAAFVADHWRYGAFIHQRAAEWLVGALAAEREPAERHVLFSRLFGEFAGTLESYAAWAWALQRRFEKGSFLSAYLDYTNSDVGQFYKQVVGHTSDLSDLLLLPTAEQIAKSAMARSAELPEEGYVDSLRAQYDRLKEAADMYFSTQRVIVDAYNKTKHGAPMVRLFEPENDLTFEIILRNRDPDDDRPFRFASFVVNDETIEKQGNNVEVITNHCRDMAAVTKVLLEGGALYARP